MFVKLNWIYQMNLCGFHSRYLFKLANPLKPLKFNSMFVFCPSQFLFSNFLKEPSLSFFSLKKLLWCSETWDFNDFQYWNIWNKNRFPYKFDFPNESKRKYFSRKSLTSESLKRLIFSIFILEIHIDWSKNFEYMSVKKVWLKCS